MSENWRPARTMGIYTRRSATGTLIEGYLDVYETNGTGAFIWSLCGDALTVAEIVDRVTERYDVTTTDAAASVGRFLDELRDRGFVS